MNRSTQFVCACAVLLWTGAAAAQDTVPGPPPEGAKPQTAPTCDDTANVKECKAACVEKFKKPIDLKQQEKEDREALEAARRLPKHGWIAIGLGGGLIAAGVVTGALALKLDGDLKDSCGGGVCGPESYGDLDRRDNLAISTSALLGTGIAVTVTGILILALFAPAPVEIEGEEVSKVRFSPMMGRGLAGAALDWRF